MILLTIGLISAIAGIVLLVWGAIDWEKPNNVATASKTFFGALLLATATWWLPENVNAGPYWQPVVDKVVGVLCLSWFLFYGVALYAILDAVFAFRTGWIVRDGHWVRDPAGVMQPQVIAYGVITAIVAIAIAVSMTRQYFGPDIAQRFYRLQEGVSGVPGVDVRVGNTVVITQDATEMTTDEYDVWVKRLVKTAADDEGLTLTIEKVHEVRSVSVNGQVIEAYVYVFTGTVENPDPARVKRYVRHTFKINSYLDEAGTDLWVNDMIARYSVIKSSNVAPPAPTKKAPQPNPMGKPAISPPKPNPIGPQQ